MTGSRTTDLHLSSAFLYGKGVFSTIAVFDGLPFLWEKHWRRLNSNAAAIGLDLSEFSEIDVLERLRSEIRDSGLSNGKVRISFFDRASSPMWSNQNETATTGLSIITRQRQSRHADLNLTVSPFPVNSRSPLAGIKSCNYLENLLAIDDAHKRGFDEAVRVNERGKITSACLANIFWVSGGCLYTPALSTGCLPGTTREFILENLECMEGEFDLDELRVAESIFLTSAGWGVVQVSEFEGCKLDTTIHQIINLLPKSKFL